MSEDLKRIVETAWEARDGINAQTKGEARDAVLETLEQLDSGRLRVAERGAGRSTAKPIRSIFTRKVPGVGAARVIRQTALVRFWAIGPWGPIRRTIAPITGRRLVESTSRSDNVCAGTG